MARRGLSDSPAHLTVTPRGGRRPSLGYPYVGGPPWLARDLGTHCGPVRLRPYVRPAGCGHDWPLAKIASMPLILIDITKARNEVLIEVPGQNRRRMIGEDDVEI